MAATQTSPMSSDPQVNELEADVSEKLLIDLGEESNPWEDSVGRRQKEKQVGADTAHSTEENAESSISTTGEANLEIQSILEQSVDSEEESEHIPEGVNADLHRHDTEKSSHSALSRDIGNPPPPEPDRPFEFGRFLDQLRHKSADPVARYMKR